MLRFSLVTVLNWVLPAALPDCCTPRSPLYPPSQAGASKGSPKSSSGASALGTFWMRKERWSNQTAASTSSRARGSGLCLGLGNRIRVTGDMWTTALQSEVHGRNVFSGGGTGPVLIMETPSQRSFLQAPCPCPSQREQLLAQEWLLYPQPPGGHGCAGMLPALQHRSMARPSPGTRQQQEVTSSTVFSMTLWCITWEIFILFSHQPPDRCFFSSF